MFYCNTKNTRVIYKLLWWITIKIFFPMKFTSEFHLLINYFQYFH